MRRRVLLIDDEKVAMQFYIKALRESGYEVIQVCDPDEAVEYMENSDERTPDIIILDIMLPPGNRFRGRPDVEEGLRTGVLLYPELRRKYPIAPIVLLTNVGNPHLLEAIPREIQIFRKVDVAPFELPDILAATLREAANEREK